MASGVADRTDAPLAALVARREACARRFFAGEATRVAQLCHRMAERFAREGRLIALGQTPAAASDARHIAVEFVHPVIVGKRALPALALTAAGGSIARQLTLIAAPDDIVVAFGDGDDDTEAALRAARRRGCATIAFAASLGAESCFIVPDDDPAVCQEIVETLYHVLWELVHVFFDHRGLLAGRAARPLHAAGASAFLYPFLDERENNLDEVLDDVRASVLMKAEETSALRARTVQVNAEAIVEAAAALRACFATGGRLLALGNGGSATDAMDLVADVTGGDGGPPHPAIDLTADAGILTAIANDIGTDAIFSRQVIAYGRRADALVALSTSGSSANVIAALEQARHQGLATIALVGYDGGRIGAERLADQVIVVPSQHIPRIQEAQATVYHLLRQLAG